MMLIEETLSRMQRKNNSRNELQQAYNKLNQFIENLNNKINSRIQLVQQVYIEDYKTQVKQMTQELKNIRNVLDEELLKQRANERLFYLEEERDFFRGQVTKLNQELNQLTQNNQSLKNALTESQAQAANYKTLVLSLQKKITKMRFQAFQTQKIKQIQTQHPQDTPTILVSKQTVSSFPTKPTLTRYDALEDCNQLSQRPSFRSVQLKRQTNHSVDGQTKKKEQILEDCIRDIKKKIFYRTLNTKNAKNVFFEEHKKIGFEKFTRSDKEDLILSILSDPDLLEQFFKFMTNTKQLTNSSSIELYKNKSQKKILDDKILKIKLSGITRQMK